MDWKGLLNWTTKVQSEQGSKTGGDENIIQEFKPMTEEDKKFLEDALASVCVNEMKKIIEILDALKGLFSPNSIQKIENVEDVIEVVEELTYLVDGVENARNVIRAKRFEELVSYYFNKAIDLKIRITIGRLIGGMMQNDKFIQAAAIKFNIFKILEVLNEEYSNFHDEDKDRVGYFNNLIYILTGIVYGEGEEGKRVFLTDYNGIKLLYNLILTIAYKENNSSMELNLNSENKKYTSLKRILTIIKELAKVEEKTSENYKVRFITIESITSIKLQNILLNILKDIQMKTEEEVETANLILNIFASIVKIYPNLEEIFKEIEILNEKLNHKDNPLPEELKKETKNNMIQVIKAIKEEFFRKEESNDSNHIVIENTKDDTSKNTIHLALK
jgi:hypothetical protein